VALGARFYREVSVGPGEGGAYSICSTASPPATPGAAMLSVPNVELAESHRGGVASSRRENPPPDDDAHQTRQQPPSTASRRTGAAVVEQVLVFARSDLICYRAPRPDELAGRQAQIGTR
jgi:hypothetical protein